MLEDFGRRSTVMIGECKSGDGHRLEVDRNGVGTSGLATATKRDPCVVDAANWTWECTGLGFDTIEQSLAISRRYRARRVGMKWACVVTRYSPSG